MAWSEPATDAAPAPYELLDDGFPPDPCEVLVIGCGNILRGDDAVGPVLVRHLVERGLPDGVRVVDGGTAGMDVAFAMRGAARVVIVDAAATGAAPGTVYRVPAEELGDLPPLDGLHSHNLRWDHALSFGSWLLGPHRPRDVTVFLVEGAAYEPGAPLSAPVEAGMEQVAALVERDFLAPLRAAAPATVEPGATVEVTAAGSLHLPAEVADRHLPGGTLLAHVEGTPGAGHRLVLVPLHSAVHGGLVLTRSTPGGDRCVLVSEAFAFAPVAGRFGATWDEERGVLVVDLERRVEDGAADGDRGEHRGGARAGAVGGLPGRDDTGGGGAPAAADAPQRTGRPAGGGHGAAHGRPAPRTPGGRS